MKIPSKNIDNPYIYIVSFLVALPVCAAIWTSKKIIWPLLCVSAKAAFKQIRKRAVKKKIATPTTQLPTPDIFKDAPNLARARSFVSK